MRLIGYWPAFVLLCTTISASVLDERITGIKSTIGCNIVTKNDILTGYDRKFILIDWNYGFYDCKSKPKDDKVWYTVDWMPDPQLEKIILKPAFPGSRTIFYAYAGDESGRYIDSRGIIPKYLNVSVPPAKILLLGRSLCDLKILLPRFYKYNFCMITYVPTNNCRNDYDTYIQR